MSSNQCVSSVDEIQYGRGHQYLTLVYQIEAGCERLLWVGEQRTRESFQKFFDLIKKELSQRIEFVCSHVAGLPGADQNALQQRTQHPGTLPHCRQDELGAR